MLGELLAFGVGLTRLTHNRAVVVVRDPGPPIPVLVYLRTKAAKDADWERVPVTHFPKKAATSPQGRRVTIVIPDGLKKYSQVCIDTNRPAPKDQRFSFVLQGSSCINLRKPSTQRA